MIYQEFFDKVILSKKRYYNKFRFELYINGERVLNPRMLNNEFPYICANNSEFYLSDIKHKQIKRLQYSKINGKEKYIVML